MLEDIAEQMELGEQPFAPFRRLPDEQRVCGPVFAGSADLGSLPGICCSTTTTRTVSTELASFSPAKCLDLMGCSWLLEAPGAGAPVPQLRALLLDHLRHTQRSTSEKVWSNT
nr:hypothetical protein [Streptomyces hygroscopicus]